MTNKINILVAGLFIVLSVSSACADGREPLCMRWNEKDSLAFWSQNTGNGAIELGKYEGRDVVRIHRSSKGTSFITKKIRAEFTGDYSYAAVIKAVDIVPGTKHYERGKFQVRLFDQYGRNLSAKRNYYPNADFNLTDDSWETMMFSVDDVKKGQIMEVRIGLQGASGTVYLADFEHCSIPPAE